MMSLFRFTAHPGALALLDSLIPIDVNETNMMFSAHTRLTCISATPLINTELAELPTFSPHASEC